MTCLSSASRTFPCQPRLHRESDCEFVEGSEHYGLTFKFDVECCDRLLKLVLQSLNRLSGLLEAQDMDERAGMIWLLDCAANVSDADLDGFASYGHGIGPEKACSGLLLSLLAPALCG